MKRWVCGLLLVAACCGVQAKDDTDKNANITKLLKSYGSMKDMVSRLDADFNGDGVTDTAIMESREPEQAFVITVFFQLHGKALEGEGQMKGLEVIDSLQLEYGGIGAPELSVKKGVLIVKYMTGGTQRTDTTYRYRFEPDESRMRLIGLDTERASRNFAAKLSWNLLTGVRTVKRGIPWTYGPESKTKLKPETILMDKTPDPDELLDNALGARASH